MLIQQGKRIIKCGNERSKKQTIAPVSQLNF